MNGGDALTNRNAREKRDYMKSGRMEYAAKAGSSEKFKPCKESGGNTMKREYPSTTHNAKKFGTTVSQGS